jgi:hypothetical protein
VGFDYVEAPLGCGLKKLRRKIGVNGLPAACHSLKLGIGGIDVFRDHLLGSQPGGELEDAIQRHAFVHQQMVHERQQQDAIEFPSSPIQERRTFAIGPTASSGRPGYVDDQRKNVRIALGGIPPQNADRIGIVIDSDDMLGVPGRKQTEVTGIAADIQKAGWPGAP